MSALCKVEIVHTAIEMETSRVFLLREANREMTEKLKAAGAYPFWYSWHPQKDGSCVFRAYGVSDKSEADKLQWDNRAARIRIGLKP